jgi:hypothetical protein
MDSNPNMLKPTNGYEGGHGVTELKLAFREADEWSYGVAETHRQEGQEYREGA